MLNLVRRNLFVFAAIVFFATVLYEYSLMSLLDKMVQLTQHGDAIPWNGGILVYPSQVRSFLIFIAPMALSGITALLLRIPPPEAPPWRHVVTVVLCIVIPIAAIFASVILLVADCVHSGSKGCFL